jgi:hypothetical protein
LASCVAGNVRWLVHGAAQGGQVTRVQGEEAPSPPIELAMGLPAALDREDPARDGIMLHCDPNVLTLYARDTEATLRRARCDARACSVGEPIANDVAGFTATQASTGEVVATTGLRRQGIAVHRLDANGAPAAPPVAPAPCWDPTGGMCGQPTLVVAGKRLLLGARDGSDLLTLESKDGGASWQRMSGLEIGTAVRTDAHSVMQQHRIRKGLD